MIFPRVFAEIEQFLSDDMPIVVRGRIRVDEHDEARKLNIVVDSLTPLDAFRLERAQSVTIELPTTAPKAWGVSGMLERLSGVLTTHPGRVPVYTSLRLPKTGRIAIELDRQYAVSPTDAFLADLREVIDAPAKVSATPGPSKS